MADNNLASHIRKTGIERKKSETEGQALLLQRYAFDAADILAERLKKESESKPLISLALALSQSLKSWDVAVERLRVIRGVGKPKVVEAVNQRPKRSRGKSLPHVHETDTDDAPEADDAGGTSKESL